MTAPYEGPFRVESRTATGMNLHLPGRGVEEVALARIRPAQLEQDDNSSNRNQETPQPSTPPAPAPQQECRRPRRDIPNIDEFNQPSGTLIPPNVPSTRRNNPQAPTQTQIQITDDPLRRLRNEGIVDSDNDSDGDTQPPAPETTNVQPDIAPEAGFPVATEEPAPTGLAQHQTNRQPGRPRFFTTNAERKFSKERRPSTALAPTSAPTPTPTPTPRGPTISVPRTFSKPTPSNFSYRRPRPDINALRRLMAEHLDE